jgi:quercetin dioxygenase-like cupin family protein
MRLYQGMASAVPNRKPPTEGPLGPAPRRRKANAGLGVFMKTLWFTGTLLLAAASSAQDAPIPVDQEPHHEVLLKNEFIEVLRVTLPPDGRTLYHTHSHDRATVELSNTSITQQKFGASETAPTTIHPGDFSVTDVSVAGPYSHRVHNLGPAIFDVVDIEFLQRPQKPSEAATTPNAGENPSARAYHWALAPGAKTPEHTHHRPYLIIAATPAQLKMLSPDGQPMLHEMKPGRFSMGRPSGHSHPRQ